MKSRTIILPCYSLRGILGAPREHWAWLATDQGLGNLIGQYYTTRAARRRPARSWRLDSVDALVPRGPEVLAIGLSLCSPPAVCVALGLAK